MPAQLLLLTVHKQRQPERMKGPLLQLLLPP
jgi:hypothetical protein